MVSSQEQVQDLRQTLMETHGAHQYSCFHLEFKNKKINDYVELSEIAGLLAGSTLHLKEDPYTEKEARLHYLRIRELIGANGGKIEAPYGIDAGLSLHDSISSWPAADQSDQTEESSLSTGTATHNVLSNFEFDAAPDIHRVCSRSPISNPKTVKSFILSPWHPPPPQLRQKGHLLYLQLTTIEGDTVQITSHVSGFYVNRSNNSKFDPSPRLAPKQASAHSLLSLISVVSPSFEKCFGDLVNANSKRDPLISFNMTNAIPASPWLIPTTAITTTQHQSDLARTQEYQIALGSDGNETLRDWNEELQSTRELPRGTVQERVFRERLISKTYAEFTEAAVKGAVLVARGEVTPLNPTESVDAQIYVYNNVFYSFGADGVGTFTSEGGDEAARAAVGKDVRGVKAINQLDVKGLSTAGTIVVDYLGKRIVAQSIVPGIFKQREPDEHQVDYGGVEGRDVIASNEQFVPGFSQVSKLLKVKGHPVWDKNGQRHFLEASVETKGLLGTDGRKYMLDLYRLTPIDISWIEDWSNADGENVSQYPHRMTVLRPELIESYFRLRMSEYAKAEIARQKSKAKESSASQPLKNDKSTYSNGVEEHQTERDEQQSDGEITGHKSRQTSDETPRASGTENSSSMQDKVDLSSFSLALNPDAFCGQKPPTDDEKAELENDENEVRSVCRHLHETVFPELLHDLREAEVGFPMDGESLSRLLHKRGINIRYLGKIAGVAQNDARDLALKSLAEQEMVARGFKHEAFRYMRNLPSVFAADCVAHLLNCFLGTELNDAPKANVDMTLKALYPDGNFSYMSVTPQIFLQDIREQVQRRYRYAVSQAFVQDIRKIQLLRSVCLKMGFQLVARDYHLRSDQATEASSEQSSGKELADSGGVKGPSVNESTNNTGRKKKKGGSKPVHQASEHEGATKPKLSFSAEDVANIYPIVKDSSPKSNLAEEALEASKISMMQSQKDIGQELLLESLTLHEQIYGVLHPEVARVYHQLAMLYFQLDEKAAALELAHKAVIISERTLGVDSSETILSYLNLALFEHGNRNTQGALVCVRHALELWNIIYGQNHPDVVTTLNNAAVMLQQLHDYRRSRVWFEKSLTINEQMSGKASVSTGTLQFQLAQALVLDGEHKAAVYRMKEAYNTFLSKLGPDDVNTKESEKWLEQLTQNAVSMAKHAKDVQARRIRRILFNPRSTRLPVDSQPQFAQAQAGLVNGNDVHSPPSLDSRSIEDLMRFIEGGGDISKASTTKKRSGRANPKRRGGTSIGATA